MRFLGLVWENEQLSMKMIFDVWSKGSVSFRKKSTDYYNMICAIKRQINWFLNWAWVCELISMFSASLILYDQSYWSCIRLRTLATSQNLRKIEQFKYHDQVPSLKKHHCDTNTFTADIWSQKMISLTYDPLHQHCHSATDEATAQKFFISLHYLHKLIFTAMTFKGRFNSLHDSEDFLLLQALLNYLNCNR